MIIFFQSVQAGSAEFFSVPMLEKNDNIQGNMFF